MLQGAVFLLIFGLVLVVDAASPGSLSRRPAVFTLLFFGIPISASTAALISGIAVCRTRLAAHEAHVASWTVKRPQSLTVAPAGDSINWVDNRYLRRLHQGILVLNLTSLTLLTVFLVVVVSPIEFPPSIFLPVLFGVPGVLAVSSTFGVVFGLSARQGVDRVGLSEVGVYFDYRHRPKAARGFLAWADVRELEGPLAVSKHSVKLDTPLGAEYVSHLDSAIIVALQQRFRAAHADHPDPSAPLPDSAGALPRMAAPSMATDTSWERNPLRDRWIRIGVVISIFEVPAMVVFLLYFLKFGPNQGDALFFLPAIYGISMIYQGTVAPREIGISSSGFSIRERIGERTIPWDEVSELTPGRFGLRYKTPTGFAEWISRVDALQVRRIVEGLVTARGFRPANPTARPPSTDPSWVVNPLHRTAARLAALMLALPAGVILMSTAVFLLVSANPSLILPMILPGIVAVFAIYPIVSWRASPARIAAASGTLFADYSGHPPGPGSLRQVPLSAVALVKPSSRTPRGVGSIGARDFGLRSVSLVVRTRAGVNITLGPISPSIARVVASRLTPDQLTEWKP